MEEGLGVFLWRKGRMFFGKGRVGCFFVEEGLGGFLWRKGWVVFCKVRVGCFLC